MVPTPESLYPYENDSHSHADDEDAFREATEDLAIPPASSDDESSASGVALAGYEPLGFSHGDDDGVAYGTLADMALRGLEEEYSSTLRSGDARRGGAEASSSERVNIEFGDSAPSPEGPKGLEETPKSSLETLSIDKEAILRAMSSVKLRAPSSTNGHPIIPKKPLLAFRRTSLKAKRATANLTRSATLSEAVHRLRLLKRGHDLSVHVVGSDGVECRDEESVKTAVGPFVRWIGAVATESPRTARVDLSFVGLSVPEGWNDREPIDLSLGLKGVVGKGVCWMGSYHEYLHYQRKRQSISRQNKSCLPDMIMIFNGGIWGYDSWKESLEKLQQWCLQENKTVPVVITAYTVQEAEDDAEVIQNIKGIHRLWPVEVNPFHCKERRDTKTAPKGRIYHDNGAWQAWMFGKHLA